MYTAGAGSSIAFIAADRLGGVLIGVTGSAPGLVYLNGGVGPVAVAVPSGAAIATIGPRHHADAHGIWFLGRTGIFLFTPPSTFQQIAAGTATDVAPGGDCI